MIPFRKGVNILLEHLENVRIINAGHRISVQKEHVKSRKYHAIFYKDQGRTLYKYGDREMVLNTDSVVFLPKGVDYYYENIGELQGKIFFVTFDCDPKLPLDILKFEFKNHGDIRKMFVKMGHSFRFGGNIGKLDAYGYFYRLLSALEQNMEYSESSSLDSERILPAVRYLQEHLFDVDLRMSILHQLCNVSAPTFRNLFSVKFGCTPKKYVINQRIQSAAELLRSEEYHSIAAVAESVGFEDQLYFSKCFKQFYGVAPSGYKAIQKDSPL